MTKYPLLKKAISKDGGVTEIVILYLKDLTLGRVIASNNHKHIPLDELVGQGFIDFEPSVDANWGDVERINTPALEYKIGDEVLVEYEVVDTNPVGKYPYCIDRVGAIDEYPMWIRPADIHSRVT